MAGVLPPNPCWYAVLIWSLVYPQAWIWLIAAVGSVPLLMAWLMMSVRWPTSKPAAPPPLPSPAPMGPEGAAAGAPPPPPPPPPDGAAGAGAGAGAGAPPPPPRKPPLVPPTVVPALPSGKPTPELFGTPKMWAPRGGVPSSPGAPDGAAWPCVGVPVGAWKAGGMP